MAFEPKRKRPWWEQVMAVLLPPCIHQPYSDLNEDSDDIINEEFAPNVYHTKERRAGFSSVHFQKEKVFKRIDKAIQRGDVADLQTALYGLDFSDFEDSAYDWTFLKKACESDALDIAAVLLRHNADANHFGASSILPLHVAVRRGNLAMCALLLSKGAKVTIATKYEHKSCLHFAVLGGQTRIAELLLEFNHEIDIADIYGETPLHAACRLGKNKLVKLLLDRQASIDAYDKEGWTGLHLAADAGHASTVSLLLDHRGNVNAQNIYGRTPLSWACTSGHVTVVQELLSRGADANIKDHNDKQAYQHAYNEHIRKLVLLHTAQKTEPFFSTIGILVQIDPRIKMSESSTATVVNVLKLWQPVPKQGTTTTSTNGNNDNAAKQTDGKENANKEHTPHRLHDSLSLAPDDSSMMDASGGTTNKQKAFVTAYTELSASTGQSLMTLEAELDSVQSYIKSARNASVTTKNEIVDNMLTCVVNLTRRVENLKHLCTGDFDTTLAIYKEALAEKSRERDLGISGYVAIVNLFSQIVIEYVASEDEGWQAFLSQVPLPSDLRNALLVKLNLEESSQEEKTGYLMNYWARNGEAFASSSLQEKSLFMRSVLTALKKCDFCETGTGIRTVTSKLFQMSQNFKTGLCSNTQNNLDTILQALSAKERNALYNYIKLESCDANLFPDLLELTSEGPANNNPDAKDTAQRRDSDSNLRETLSEAVETEDTNTVAILVEHLIMNKNEHLLIHLL